MMKGVLEFLTNPFNKEAKLLRENFVFKIIPMLNPDGVINGNYRCSLAGCDLNRRWKNPSKLLHPTVYYTKKLCNQINQERGVVMFCDLHGHSRKQNVFMYGCNIQKNPGVCRMLPFLLSKINPFFSFEYSRFGVQKSKEATARIALFRELKSPNVFTMESSFAGMDEGKYAGQHFTVEMLSSLGKDLCRSILAHQNIFIPEELRKLPMFRKMQDKPGSKKFTEDTQPNFNIQDLINEEFAQDESLLNQGDGNSSSGSDDAPSEDNLQVEDLQKQLPPDKTIKEAVKKIQKTKKETEEKKELPVKKPVPVVPPKREPIPVRQASPPRKAIVPPIVAEDTKVEDKKEDGKKRKVEMKDAWTQTEKSATAEYKAKQAQAARRLAQQTQQQQELMKNPQYHLSTNKQIVSSGTNQTKNPVINTTANSSQYAQFKSSVPGKVSANSATQKLHTNSYEASNIHAPVTSFQSTPHVTNTSFNQPHPYKHSNMQNQNQYRQQQPMGVSGQQNSTTSESNGFFSVGANNGKRQEGAHGGQSSSQVKVDDKMKYNSMSAYNSMQKAQHDNRQLQAAALQAKSQRDYQRGDYQTHNAPNHHKPLSQNQSHLVGGKGGNSSLLSTDKNQQHAQALMNGAIQNVQERQQKITYNVSQQQQQLNQQEAHSFQVNSNSVNSVSGGRNGSYSKSGAASQGLSSVQNSVQGGLQKTNYHQYLKTPTANSQSNDRDIVNVLHRPSNNDVTLQKQQSIQQSLKTHLSAQPSSQTSPNSTNFISMRTGHVSDFNQPLNQRRPQQSNSIPASTNNSKVGYQDINSALSASQSAQGVKYPPQKQQLESNYGVQSAGAKIQQQLSAGNKNLMIGGANGVQELSHFHNQTRMHPQLNAATTNSQAQKSLQNVGKQGREGNGGIISSKPLIQQNFEIPVNGQNATGVHTDNEANGSNGDSARNSQRGQNRNRMYGSTGPFNSSNSNRKFNGEMNSTNNSNPSAVHTPHSMKPSSSINKNNSLLHDQRQSAVNSNDQYGQQLQIGPAIVQQNIWASSATNKQNYRTKGRQQMPINMSARQQQVMQMKQIHAQDSQPQNPLRSSYPRSSQPQNKQGVPVAGAAVVNQNVPIGIVITTDTSNTIQNQNKAKSLNHQRFRQSGQQQIEGTSSLITTGQTSNSNGILSATHGTPNLGGSLRVGQAELNTKFPALDTRHQPKDVSSTYGGSHSGQYSSLNQHKPEPNGQANLSVVNASLGGIGGPQTFELHHSYQDQKSKNPIAGSEDLGNKRRSANNCLTQPTPQQTKMAKAGDREGATSKLTAVDIVNITKEEYLMPGTGSQLHGANHETVHNQRQYRNQSETAQLSRGGGATSAQKKLYRPSENKESVMPTNQPLAADRSELRSNPSGQQQQKQQDHPSRQ